MELRKYGHAAIAIIRDGRTLVIDAGGLTGPDALVGANAALVTHEHFDHFDGQKLRAALDADPEFEVWTNASVAQQLEGAGSRVHVVGAGDEFTAAGFGVRVFGEWHAEVHKDIPLVGNVGFLVERSVFHPGDAFTVPGQPVDTLLLPVHGPWSRTGQLIDWVREVAPARTFAVHDGALNDIGLATVDRLLGEGTTGVNLTHVRPGEHVDVS
jgi:L-ascorbate metabolism protein UlaG (beta-lactamase superfamily)